MTYETEQAIIGSLLTDQSCIDEIYDVTPEMFTDGYLGKVYHIIKTAYDSGRTADNITVWNELVREVPEDIAGRVLRDCAEADFLTTNIVQYADILKREYAAKKLNDFVNQHMIDGKNVTEIVPQLAEMLESIKPTRTGAKTASELVSEYSSQRFISTRDQGVSLGYKCIDDILQNLDKGDLCIVASRPSVGKSALTTEIALNVANQGLKVGMFSLEMTSDQIYDRMIAHESGIELNRIRRALAFQNDEKERFDRGNAKIEALKDRFIVYDDKRKVSEMSVEVRKNRFDVVIIDYAQLIQGEGVYKGNRYAEVGEISHSVKWMAKKHKIPVILLAQLNRRTAGMETSEPSMSDLRESGDFEQDASQIILLWNKDEDRHIKGVKIDKNRQGQVGTAELIFNGATMHFTDRREETPFD